MKLALFSLVALCLVATCYCADGSDFDYEQEAVAAPAPTKASPKSKLSGLLSQRNRNAGSLTARKSPAPATASPKTTTTTEAVAEQAEEDYEEGAEEEGKQDVVTTTSTTEAPKKPGRGGVRPFRSNEDLLAVLKRRRAQGPTSITKEPSSTQVPTDAALSKTKPQSSPRAKTNEVSKSSSRGRFSAARSKPATQQVQEEAEETKTEDVKAKPYRARG